MNLGNGVQSNGATKLSLRGLQIEGIVLICSYN